MFVTGGPTEEAIDRLLRQLEIGLPAQALGLVEIPIDLARGDYFGLLAAGIQTADQTWQLPDERIVQLLGPLVGKLLVSKRPQMQSK